MMVMVMLMMTMEVSLSYEVPNFFFVVSSPNAWPLRCVVRGAWCAETPQEQFDNFVLAGRCPL